MNLFRAEWDRHVRRRTTWITAVVMWLLVLVFANDPQNPGADAGFPVLFPVLIVFGMLAGFVSAAANVGQDISSGALGTWLTFHPNRLRVWAARLIAMTLATLLMCVVAIPLALTASLNAPYGLTDMRAVHLIVLMVVTLFLTSCATVWGATLAAVFGSILSTFGALAAYLGVVFIGTELMPITSSSSLVSGPLGPVGDLVNAALYSAYLGPLDTPHNTSPLEIHLIYLSRLAAPTVKLMLWNGVALLFGSLWWYRRDID